MEIIINLSQNILEVEEIFINDLMEKDILSMSKGEERLAISHDNATHVRAFKIIYMSNGRRVKGYIVQPKKIEALNPVVILNRGGSKHVSQWEDAHMFGNFVCNFARLGRVVFMSQYSGNDGSEGKDEFGGMDLDDVLNLKNLIDEIKYTDPSDIIMCGGSRGGLMTYLSLRYVNWIKAACIWSASSDMTYSHSYRPDLKLWHSDMYDITDEEQIVRRSPIKWVDKLDRKPLLLFHGFNDDIVKLDEVLNISKAFYKIQYPFKLVIYPG